MICEHCHGAGGTGTTAYSECQWCGGAGKVHEGCREQNYVELAESADAAEAAIARVRADVSEWAGRSHSGFYDEAQDDAWKVVVRALDGEVSND